jgi:hypothetical protein
MMQAAAGAAGGDVNYIDDVFNTWVYTGNGSTQTITNGIDLAGEGGMVWIKGRNLADTDNNIQDTARGITSRLISNATVAAATGGVTSVSSSGFSLNSFGGWNENTYNFASWTFRKQPKFFDVVTYTGNGSMGLTINHNLGSVPGMIIVKKTTTAGTGWAVYHRSLGNDKIIMLNTTAVSVTDNWWNDTTPTSTQFFLSSDPTVNAFGDTFVAYLFAHDAGGFGETGTDNVISCGGFTASGGSATVNLGYEPQLVLLKSSSAIGGWLLMDNIRDFCRMSATRLAPNTDAVESQIFTGEGAFTPTATGFSSNQLVGSTTYIYMAIRRPMKPPTVGTEVFSPITRTGNGAASSISGVGFPTDLAIYKRRNASGGVTWTNRLVGKSRQLTSNNANAEGTASNQITGFDFMTSVSIDDATVINASGGTYINWMLKRATGFFDIVCYTGTGSATTFNHNLTVAPELMIVKRRDSGTSWSVYSAYLPATSFLQLSDDSRENTGQNGWWNSTRPTSSVFTVGTDGDVNASGGNYIAYLFASVGEISKLGSYTGTAATQTINAGLPTGARFVMIKRTDFEGNWWVWDTARGMVTSTDPRVAFNSENAESNNDWVFTVTNGFQIVTSDATVNASGGNYIYLAIA